MHQRAHVTTVDFARGVAAAGVMFYHLLHGEQIVTVSRVGYYFVYAFFVISGFSLYITYRDRLRTADEVALYFLKRLLRIAPLFWIACFLNLALIYGQRDDLWYRLFLNLTLTFGFADPGSASLVGGGWSIGIEAVFYILFPVLLLFAGGHVARLAWITAGATVVMIIFVNHTLDGHPTMKGVWPEYTQPIAFFGYFAFGCLLGEVFHRNSARLKGARFWVFIFAASTLPFFIIDATHPNEVLVGSNALVFLCSTYAAVGAIAFMREPTGVWLEIARWFGRMSYPVYLLHPIAYRGVVVRIADDPWIVMILTAALTVVAAEIVNRFVETPFRNLVSNRSANTTAGAGRPSAPMVE